MTSLNDVDLENQEVTAYSATAAGLAEMRERFNPALIPEQVTDENYPMVKEAATTLQKLRTGLDKKRKAIKAPYLEATKLIDGQAKELTEQISAIEEPWKAAKAEYDERAKRKEEARQAKIEEVFTYLNTVRENAYTMDSASLSEALEQLNAETCVDAMERAPEALELRNKIIDTVGDLYVQKAEQERMEAENAKLREAQRVDTAIADFGALVGTMIDADRAALERKIEGLETEPMPDYGERTDSVAAARDKALAGLRKLLAMLPEEEQTPADKNPAQEWPDAGLVAKAASKPVKLEDEREIKLVIPESRVSAVMSLLMDQFSVEQLGADSYIIN